MAPSRREFRRSHDTLVVGMDGPTIDLIDSVRGEVAARTRRTPLLRSEWLSERTGAEVLLKCENLQRTGSFKLRGAVAALAVHHPAAVVTASAGNHGQGLAVAARAAAIPCVVVVPRSIPRVKEEGIRATGARVVRAPHNGYDDTEAWTRAHLDELGGRFVSPFDDPAVMAGNGGTLALEIIEEAEGLDVVVVPCGGGGCAVGMGGALRARSPRTRVVAVNTDASAGMWLSRRDGWAHLRVHGRPTICDGLEGGVSERTFALGLELIDEVVLAAEATIRAAVIEIARQEHLLVEGAGAAGVAALLDGVVDIRGRRACVLLSGGNIDLDRFAGLAPPPEARVLVG
jgi:threonine dehydratase